MNMPAIGQLGGDGVPSERVVLPPPLRPANSRTSNRATTPNDQRYIGTIIAVMATLDLGTVSRLAPSELPPEIRWATQSLSDDEWAAVFREAIRAQHLFTGAAQGIYRRLRRSEPWPLAEFLPTVRL
jgi:hypothetical protein